jgi:pimeloyl-ACP methyl ester carboxylesterase
LLRDYPKWIDDNLEPFVTPEISPGMMGWIRAMALGASLQALHDCHIAISTTDFRSELPHVTVPALLLHGGADATSPIEITARATEKLMPHAELVVYEGAPHGIPYTHTDRLNRDLLTVLAG